MIHLESILGMSLGTRSIGIAVLIDGDLVDWSLKSFKTAWSDQKKELILDAVDQMLERYSVSSFAIKVPSFIETHPEMRELHTEINLLAQTRKIPTETYTIKSLKEFCGADVSNKRTLRRKVLKYFPDLAEYDTEIRQKHSYYTKLFEAALAAHMLYHTSKSIGA